MRTRKEWKAAGKALQREKKGSKYLKRIRERGGDEEGRQTRRRTDGDTRQFICLVLCAHSDSSRHQTQPSRQYPAADKYPAFLLPKFTSKIASFLSLIILRVGVFCDVTAYVLIYSPIYSH